MPETAAGVPLKGVVLVACATLSFAAADVATKHLTTVFEVPLILALRYLVNLVLLVAIYAPARGRALWRTSRTGLVVLRGLLLAAASITMSHALKVMPVAETTAIIYLAPLLVMVLAKPVLGETVGRAGWIAAGMGFVGVLLIVRPGSGLVGLGVALALCNATLSSGYHLLSRLLSRSESTMALLVWTAAIGTVVFGILLCFDWQTPGGTLFDWAILLSLGVLATLGHFLFTAAYREAPAALLAPVNYLHLFWSTGLGWIFFHQFPTPLSLGGIGLVALAGILVALRTRPRRRPVIAV